MVHPPFRMLSFTVRLFAFLAPAGSAEPASRFNAVEHVRKMLASDHCSGLEVGAKEEEP